MLSSDPSLANTVYSSGEIGAGFDFIANAMAGYDSRGTGSTLKFDVQPQIAGRLIRSATLRLWVHELRSDFTVSPQIRVSAFANDWDPATLTWNTWAQLQCQLSSEARQTAPSTSDQPVDFDVTTIVRNWASGAFGNYGLRLMVDPWYPGHTPSLGTTLFESLETRDAASHRPQLIVNFQ